MSKIYIFGDSFFYRWIETGIDYGWIVQLTNKHFVVNSAIPGASNHEIYLSFLKYSDIITPDDYVIIGWSDPSRFYVNSGISKNEKTYRVYYEKFYNKALDTLQQKTFMSEIKKIIKEKNFKTLFFWSFPSDYIDAPKENTNWADAIASNIDTTKYYYLDTFENEVRPALVYFSKNEVEQTTSSNNIIDYFKNKDNRPNHIGNVQVHNELTKIVEEFIKGRISGQIDLIKRLSDGS